ncbi:MAG: aminopeptidase [Clostridia bacterium]|nr:aminopeptidase [Clostridia bacterium]
MNKLKARRYAKLLVKCGLNLKKGQTVFLTVSVDQVEFAKMVLEELYRAGAKRVVTEWVCDETTKIDYEYQSLETMSEVTPWAEAKLKYKADNLSCRLFIESSDPDAMQGVDGEKIAKARQAQFPIVKPYRDAIENKHQWCIAAAAGKDWAKKLFPDLSDKQAVEALWDKIFEAARADGADPIKDWARHNDDLSKKCDYLNSLKLTSLEYKSSNGTDLKVGLLKNCLWMGGAEATLAGRYFNPNIPSEEVFTSPKAGSAEGIVYATKPLSYQGQLIENFSVRFENGRVVEVKAEKNQELLQKMVSMDEGAAMLGECALIPYNSPINNTGILFYNTLFDENASCHLALGNGFTNCLVGFERMTQEECIKKGINDSMIHVDFMIGSKDLSIVGVTESGERVEIFKDGDWAIEF